MPFTFLHAADLHLDTPFSSVGTAPDDVLAELREASLQAWRNLVDEAVGRGVAFVVLAGDIYDGARRGLRAQQRFLDGLTHLHDEGIHTFVAYGNHDPVEEGWSAITTLPPSVHEFPAAKGRQQAQAVSIDVDGEPVTVTGLSFATQHTTENLSHRFPEATGRGLQLAVLHANVGTDTGHSPYSPCTLGDLRATGYHYWALGHVHRRSVLCEGDPWVVYPGDLQGRSPKPAECEPKGAIVVEASAAGVTGLEFVPLDVVRFVDLSIDIAEHSVESLLGALQDRAAPAAHDGRSVIVRATLHGAGPVHEELLGSAARAEVLDLLRDRDAGLPFVWWDRLRWATRPPADQAGLAGGSDFLGDLLALAGRVGAGATALAPPAVPAELARLLKRGREDGEGAEPTEAELLPDATQVAVDAVLEAAS